MPRGTPTTEEETRLIVQGLRAGRPRALIAAELGITYQGLGHKMNVLYTRGVLGRTSEGRWYVLGDSSRWYEVTISERVWAKTPEDALRKAGVRTAADPWRLDAGPLAATARSITGVEQEGHA